VLLVSIGFSWKKIQGGSDASASSAEQEVEKGEKTAAVHERSSVEAHSA
jgi:hypothetical protein